MQYKTSVRVSLLFLAFLFTRSFVYSAEELFATRPVIAIWRDADRGSRVPSLRIAIWNDGRVLFAKDPKKWGQELLEVRIDPDRVAEIKRAIAQTGVNELKGTCYLVPDAPVFCMMIDLGEKQQMLYWDERENPNYGINISPKPQHIAFKACWKEVNKLALAALPAQSQPYPGKFSHPPQSWRLKKQITSE